MKYTYILLSILLFSFILPNHLKVYAINSSPYSVIAELLNVPESEVPELLFNQTILLEGNKILIPLLDESIYGGTYIDLVANKIFINTIDISKNGSIINNPVMKPYLNLLSFVEVNNSLSKLNEIFNQVNILVNNFDVVNVIISNQYKVNNIVIYLDQPELYQAFINSTKKLNPTPIIEGPNEAIKENSSSTLKSRENNSPILESRENNSPTLESRENNSPTLESREIQLRILSGYSIVRREEGFRYRCTAGFWVRQQGLTYLATAGHCALNSTDPHGSIRFFFIIPGTNRAKFFGNMTRFEVEPVDRGFILPSDEHFESPYIYSHEIQAPMFAIADFTRTPVHFIDGTILCKSGSTTGYSCGRVKSIIVNSVIFRDGYGKFNYTGMVEVKTRGAYGDSGSPVFSFSNQLDLSRTGVNLFGMVIGVTRDESTILFTPLYQILDSDMDVVTIDEL
ncbi:S1 family peptidase [Gigaspora margarita]|uniref:S1 family peptidase n=1 Tax=Gigaspora margarita TaxID=4874 RepID=A0A8H4EMD4_GIGMA|nr:S1 family peptidase [Gigaspora margarita]